MITDQLHHSRFIIAAPSSNAGKTTITLGLLRLLRDKGISVQPFKVGPDFIDPKFHEQACGTTGVNLDLFMMSERHIEQQLHSAGSAHQVSCIEGVMGLFDGAHKAERSTAELAIKTETPVVLVVDAKAVAYSVAALIQGFKQFDSRLSLLGVIFNRVGSERHYSFLKDACDDVGVAALGYLKRLENAQIPSRHLGLNIEQLDQFDEAISAIAAAMEQTVDWQLLLRQTALPQTAIPDLAATQTGQGQRFAVAHDEAFSFIYPQHIQAMESLGTVSYFSPMRDQALPEADFVYLPGGYPECYLELLAANEAMKASIKAHVKAGGKVYAECGGMMYLGKYIADKAGTSYQMVGVFDFATSMEHAKMHLGYRKVSFAELRLKGHEFHYSTFSEQPEPAATANISNANDVSVNTELYIKHRVIASYMHLYLGDREVLRKLINHMDNLQL